jgi:hypothetical protein
MRAARTRRAPAADQTAAIEFSLGDDPAWTVPRRRVIDRSLQSLASPLRIRNFCHLLRPSAADHYHHRGI